MDFPDSKEILHNITKIIWDMHCHFFLCSSLTLFHFIPWVRISIRNVDSLPCGGHIACDANIDWEPTLTSSWPTGAGLVIRGWGGQHGGQVNFLRGQVTLVQLIHPTERGLGPVMDWKIIKLKGGCHWKRNISRCSVNWRPTDLCGCCLYLLPTPSDKV